MIFKGTKKLSEADIDIITTKLSGSCNAFTSYDYTGYSFDFPEHNWKAALPIMADCMENCIFREDLLNSELKAVIQELKMYKDNYLSSLAEEIMSSMFNNHPYHYPIIGYKQDLWNLNRESLINFYKKHYLPNNAVLIVVGDVNPEEVFKLVENNFGNIEPNKDYKKEEFYLNKDLASKSTTIYRDIKQPVILLSYLIPGVKENIDYVIDIASWILASGRGSRLYKKLVNDLSLVTDVEAFSQDLFDQAVFFFYYQPKDLKDIDKINEIIQEEVNNIIKNDITARELSRAIKKTEMSYMSLLESNYRQAYFIGKNYLAKKDEGYINKYLDFNQLKLTDDVKKFLSDYIRPSVVNIGKVLPLPEDEKDNWLKLQKISDEEDKRILSMKIRESEIESLINIEDIPINTPKKFDFPDYKSFDIKNGIRVLYYNNPKLSKIDLILDLKAKYYYEPEGLQGISDFMCQMLLEGTKKYTASELADEIESLGMTINVVPGYVTMTLLSGDLEKGLTLLKEILTESIFDEKSIEKIRSHLISNLYMFWDNPGQFVGQLAKEQVYKNHPYSKNILGNLESLNKITKKDLVDLYKNFISPFGAKIAIVGDLGNYNLQEVLDRTLGEWDGLIVPTIDFPDLQSIKHQEINYKINRDQVVLAFAGKSIKRKDPDFDKIFIFDQIFTGGLLGTMSSRLFKIRMQTGLFYTIGGSLLDMTGKQPGMIFIQTMVSLDRLQEAEDILKKVIDSSADFIDKQEFEDAKNAIINSLISNFSTNYKTAMSFLFLEEYNMPKNFFEARPEMIQNVKIEEVQDAVRKILKSDSLLVIKVGRI
jgi:zinc protease